MESCVYKRAITPQERVRAQALITAEYRRVGYIKEGEEGSSLSKNLFLDSTVTFIAVAGDTVYGTISLFFDREGGLPMEHVWCEEIRDIRANHTLIAEAGQFAVQSSIPALDRLPIVLGLFRLVLQELHEKKIDVLCISVHVKHQHFYERLGFKLLGSPRFYGPVGVEQAVGMSLTIGDTAQFTRFEDLVLR